MLNLERRKPSHQAQEVLLRVYRGSATWTAAPSDTYCVKGLGFRCQGSSVPSAFWGYGVANMRIYEEGKDQAGVRPSGSVLPWTGLSVKGGLVA